MTTTSLLERLSRFRIVALLVVILLTIFWFYHAYQIRLYDDPNKWPPQDDPNVLVNDLIQDEFGGANVVTVQLTVKEGDIFNSATLAKIKRIHDELVGMRGVVREYETSLASLKIKYMKGSDECYEIAPLMADAPQSEADIERIKYGVLHNPTIYGSLVSLDAKSTMFLADFRTGEQDSTTDTGRVLPRTDPVTIYKEIKRIIEAESDANTSVVMAGSPIIIGWVNSVSKSYIFPALGSFLLVMAVILGFVFKRVIGIILPLVVGLTASVWAFGIQAFFFGDILKSSSALIAPFIILAGASCHSVVFLRRFFDEEYPSAGEAIPALQATVLALFIPMLVSLITDIGAFFVLSYVPFKNVSLLGSITALGLASVLILFYLLGLPLLSYFPGKVTVQISEQKVNRPGYLESGLAHVIKSLVERSRTGWAVMAGLTGVLVISIFIISRVEPGQNNTYAIHNYLTKSWKGNPIFEMEMDIKGKFGAIYPMNILLKAQEEEGLKSPDVMKKIDSFSKYLAKEFPEIHGVSDLPLYVKLMHRFLNAESDQFFCIPEKRATIGEYLEFYEQGQPGTFDAIMDPDFNKTILAAYTDTTDPKIVRKLIKGARDYAQDHFNGGDIEASIAGGTIGIADAFNRNIATWLLWSIILSGLASFMTVMILFRSLLAPVLLLIPLLVSVIIWLAVMYLTGIEINSNTTTAMAIAMGVGIDAEIYFLYRFREEYAKSKEFRTSLISAFTKILSAIIFSNAALILASWSLIPIPLYVGYVGFSMGMVLLISFCTNVIICPFLWSLVRPKFLLR